LAKANLHGAKDQKVLAGGDRESVGAGFTDSGMKSLTMSYLFMSLPSENAIKVRSTLRSNAACELEHDDILSIQDVSHWQQMA
ncbi:hypothetical protein ACQKE4_20085, partial [Halomonas sp. NPDC076908]|uniref:hypothetical protein n=1 Tax=Halomonas sp. NPDC076908 TaxID=3390567 RepID=UPI003D08C8B8